MTFNIDKIYRVSNGIYIIRSLIDDRVYIGSATNFYKRFSRHLSALRNNHHHNIKLQNFFNKYGENTLSFELISIVENRKDLFPMEQYYLDLLHPYIDGFNIATDVKSMSHITREHRISTGIKRLGTRLSESWKLHVSEALKEKWATIDHPNTGRLYPVSHKQAMSISNKKRVSEGRNRMIENIKIGKQSGERHPRTTLTDNVVRLVKKDMKEGIKRQVILDKYKISVHVYKDIQRGKTWSHINIEDYENTY